MVNFLKVRFCNSFRVPKISNNVEKPSSLNPAVTNVTYAVNTGGDQEAIERIQDSIVELEARNAKMKQVLDELMDSDRSKHDSLDFLQNLLDEIRSSIVTREIFEQVVDDKVNRDEFANTVKKTDFEAEIERFSIHLNEFSTKLAD